MIANIRLALSVVALLGLAVPAQARFLQVDPVGYDDQFNLYAYVGNDPVNMTDPIGEEGACIYAPGACGMRPLTPQEERRRDEAYSAVGSVALLFVPAERLVRGPFGSGGRPA